MKFRIVEFKPYRYKAQRRYFVIWKRIVKASFVTIRDAEKSIELYKKQRNERRDAWLFIPRVVKEL